MQQRKIVCIVLMLCATLKVSAQNAYEARVKKYIEQYKDWAIEEQRRSGVPASITLAQGIHETSAGNSELATNANNHFGIKCRKEWTGQTYAYTDDAPDECFRKYPSALQSYKDHSDYLAGSKRYDALFKLSIKDYKGWAHGLKRCGYATNPKYAQLLVKLVEEYDLQQYTLVALQDDYNPVRDAEQATNNSIANNEMAIEQNATQQVTKSSVNNAPKTSGKKSSMSVSYGVIEQPLKKKIDEENIVDNPSATEYGKLVKVNGVKAFYAKKGTVLLEDAFKYNIRYAKLLEINELPDLPLEADMYVYLEKKNTKGIHLTHIVRPGETLIQIAQAQAMQLKYLKYYNRIAANEEPATDAVLQLQQYSENKPPTYVKTIAPREETVAFAGSNPNAIPQGAIRKRASYISKKEIKAAQERQEPIAIEEPKQNENINAELPLIEDQPAKKKMPEIVASETPEEKIALPTPTPDIIAPKIEEQKVAQKEEHKDTPIEIVKEEKESIAEPAIVQSQVIPKTASLPSVNVEPFIEEQPTERAKPDVKTSAKKEAVEYDVIQPEPIIVSNKKEEISIPKAEIINPVAPVKTDIKPVKAEMTVVKAPAKKEVPQMPEEPKDEFERLKRKLDKVVYAGVPTPVETKAEVKKEEIKKEEVKKQAVLTSEPSKTYTVKKGDTAFSIAKKHNITMHQLMDWNKLDFDKIKEGQKLRVKP